MESPSVKAQRLLNELFKLQLRESDPVPPGFMDSIAWGKEFKLTRQNAKKRLEKMVKVGLIKKITLRRWTRIGYKKIDHYGE